MKVSTEKRDNNEVVLTVEENAQKLDEGIKRAYKALANRIEVPGFRKGKTPPHILERRLGKSYITEEAFDIIYPKLVGEAIKESGTHPVTRPELNVVTLEEGKDLNFTLTFTDLPEVTLGEYKGLKIPREEVAVSDEAVDEQLKTFQKRKAKMFDAPDGSAVEKGDFITLDFEGFMNGEPFEGGQAKDCPLEIGSGNFIAGFEDQLVGAKIGEELDINVTFPEDYHAENLAGKPAVFKCTVHTIKRQELPPLNDELVKEVSKFTTVDELRADVRKNLEIAAKRNVEAKRNAEAVKQAVDNASVEIPPVLIENRVDALVENMTTSIKQRGLDVDTYLEYTDTDMTKVREEFKEKALNDVKSELVLDKVAKTEDLKLSSEEIAVGLAEMAVRFGTNVKQVSKALREADKYDDFLVNLLNQKAVKFIVDSTVE